MLLQPFTRNRSVLNFFAILGTALGTVVTIYAGFPGGSAFQGLIQMDAFAVFFHNFSTFLGKRGLYLEDLFVIPDMRGKGFGRALLVHLAGIARERGCGRFEWAVLDWNQPAIDFYEKLGAVPMKEWTIFRVTGAALDRLAVEDRES